MGIAEPGRPRLRGMQRVAAMQIELRIDRNGQTIFRAECDTERGSSFAEFSKLALREFNQRHPEVSLLDDDIWLAGLRRGSLRAPLNCGLTGGRGRLKKGWLPRRARRGGT
jgi:hypothetical protein